MRARLTPPLIVLVCAASAACAPPELYPMVAKSTARSSSAAMDGLPETSDEASFAQSAWAPVTKSPWSPSEGEVRDAREDALAKVCGTRDAALDRVAHELALLRAKGLGADPDAVTGRMRAAGEPHVRPRVLFASGHAPLDEASLRTRLAEVVTAQKKAERSEAVEKAERSEAVERTERSEAVERTERSEAVERNERPARCGVAIAGTPHGGEVLVAVAVEVLADMAPLATRARAGEWLSFDAQLRVPARGAKLVILGPRGAPRTVPTSLDASTGRARARFALDQPGAFTIQLVADLDEGPRPLLEARVFAEVSPTPLDEDPIAPGEDAAADLDEGREPEALLKMLGAVRSMEGLPALRRDERLDAIARAHAEHMRDRKTAAHDVGDGDPRARFEADPSLSARAVGENVAHAASVRLAHRALHASPSHRMNLLRNDYTHVGVGVARAPDGSVYVCETFAAAAR